MKRNRCGSTGFCGLCYAGAKGRSSHQGHYGFRAVVQRLGPTGGREVKRSVNNSEGLPQGVACVDPEFSARYPNLWEHLSASRWEDGSSRETSTLMTLCEMGVVKMGLNDRAEGRSMWVSGTSVNAVLEALEANLETGRGDWRAKQQVPSRKKS